MPIVLDWFCCCYCSLASISVPFLIPRIHLIVLSKMNYMTFGTQSIHFLFVCMMKCVLYGCKNADGESAIAAIYRERDYDAVSRRLRNSGKSFWLGKSRLQYIKVEHTRDFWPIIWAICSCLIVKKKSLEILRHWTLWCDFCLCSLLSSSHTSSFYHDNTLFCSCISR